MATAWVRSLSCKSNAVAAAVAVVDPPPNKPPPLLPVSCAATHVVKNSVVVVPAKNPPRARPRARDRPKPKTRPKKKPKAPQFMPSPAARPARSAFLTMTELPEGHSSRRVVELIFASGWGAEAAQAAVVEALFRVRNSARAVACFEEARAAARAGAAAARCAADGNEMMRFQCRAGGGGDGEVFNAGIATCPFGPSESAVRTFAGSGAAHASAGGGAGRRAMLVCRVIAGRVRPANDSTRHTSEYDSVDVGHGELVVLDSRGVLPCFLIIYKV